MLKKITSLLICTVMLITATPSKIFAQTLARLDAAVKEQSANDSQVKQTPGLKVTFAELTARSKTGASLEANIKRLEREALNANPQSSYTKKDKIIIISVVVGLVVLAVVLGLTTKKGGHTFCSDDPSDPNCLPS